MMIVRVPIYDIDDCKSDFCPVAYIVLMIAPHPTAWLVFN
jgi:hypothetical protein